MVRYGTVKSQVRSDDGTRCPEEEWLRLDGTVQTRRWYGTVRWYGRWWYRWSVDGQVSVSVGTVRYGSTVSVRVVVMVVSGGGVRWSVSLVMVKSVRV